MRGGFRMNPKPHSSASHSKSANGIGHQNDGSFDIIPGMNKRY
ncbi:MAG: hypothetical protein H6R08_2046 [Proteobacteria bacterium]|nr:hypothetical protein [Pseudomonadota bacterium]